MHCTTLLRTFAWIMRKDGMLMMYLRFRILSGVAVRPPFRVDCRAGWRECTARCTLRVLPLSTLDEGQCSPLNSFRFSRPGWLGRLYVPQTFLCFRDLI